MVRGLDIFRKRFAAYVDQYVLIGGTAATLTMEEAGLEFRATKDLDIVLHVEALTPAFGEAFWTFVEDGGYEIRQASDTGNQSSIGSRSPLMPATRRWSSCSREPPTGCDRLRAVS